MTTQRDLINELRTDRTLPLAWADTFAAVDRAAFIPARVWFDDTHGQPQPLDRDTEPDRWAGAVYSDEPIVTQFDDGATAWPAVGQLVTSSCSQPSAVLAMLDALDVRDGHRVLEIGTGTGWNAALLSERLGADRVTTIEVDQVLAEQARTALSTAGHKPVVVHGDGAAGWAAGAPYNRVLCTAAVGHGRVPYAWVEQTRPGGQILFPWATAYRSGVLVRLTVAEDGTASGPVVGLADFMRIRAHRADAPFGQAHRMAVALYESPDTTSRDTAVQPMDAVTGDGAFAVGLRLPDVQCGVFFQRGGGGAYEALLYHVPTESVASLMVSAEQVAAGPWTVRQVGSRRLWDEAEAAHAQWVADGWPRPTRHGLTVTPERQWVWLDEPGHAVDVG